MTETFVDAVAWIALLNTRDSLHDAAKSVLRTLREQGRRLVTTEFVLIELANSLSAPNFRTKVSVLFDGLMLEDKVEIIPATSRLFLAGFALYRSRPDKLWSLIDCTSFVIMTERGVSDAFTQDRHFEQAGFNNLL